MFVTAMMDRQGYAVRLLPPTKLTLTAVPLPHYLFHLPELLGADIIAILDVLLVAFLGFRWLGFRCDVAAGLLWFRTHYSSAQITSFKVSTITVQ